MVTGMRIAFKSLPLPFQHLCDPQEVTLWKFFAFELVCKKRGAVNEKWSREINCVNERKCSYKQLHEVLASTQVRKGNVNALLKPAEKRGVELPRGKSSEVVAPIFAEDPRSLLC